MNRSLWGRVTFHVEAWLKLHFIAAVYLFKECAQRIKAVFTSATPKTYCCVGKKTAVVTGGTRGLGLETVKSLLALNVRVIVGSSSPEQSQAAKECFEKCIPGSAVEILPLDLRSMSSVGTFAQEILRRNVVIDMLICGAGVMFTPYEVTEDGFESQLSINYLGHCLLTALLLPRLISAGTPKRMARIINVSSCVHKVAHINFDDIHGRHPRKELRRACMLHYLRMWKASVASTLKNALCLSQLHNPKTVACKTSCGRRPGTAYNLGFHLQHRLLPLSHSFVPSCLGVHYALSLQFLRGCLSV
ncbi:polyprenol dehydrogenase-like isoform X2 [Amblyomma americanum]